jgi:hypothetical protein
LNNNNNEFKLKSIYFDAIFRDPTGNILPFDNNDTQVIALTIGNMITRTPQITRNFVNFNPAIANQSLGAAFNIFKTGQLFFDLFYFISDMHIVYNATNNDPIVSYEHLITIVIEIDDTYLVK